MASHCARRPVPRSIRTYDEIPSGVYRPVKIEIIPTGSGTPRTPRPLYVIYFGPLKRQVAIETRGRGCASCDSGIKRTGHVATVVTSAALAATRTPRNQQRRRAHSQNPLGHFLSQNCAIARHQQPHVSGFFPDDAKSSNHRTRLSTPAAALSLSVNHAGPQQRNPWATTASSHVPQIVNTRRRSARVRDTRCPLGVVLSPHGAASGHPIIREVSRRLYCAPVVRL
jgi:hypothetical protein